MTSVSRGRIGSGFVPGSEKPRVEVPSESSGEQESTGGGGLLGPQSRARVDLASETSARFRGLLGTPFPTGEGPTSGPFPSDAGPSEKKSADRKVPPKGSPNPDKDPASYPSGDPPEHTLPEGVGGGGAAGESLSSSRDGAPTGPGEVPLPPEAGPSEKKSADRKVPPKGTPNPDKDPASYPSGDPPEHALPEDLDGTGAASGRRLSDRRGSGGDRYDPNAPLPGPPRYAVGRDGQVIRVGGEPGRQEDVGKETGTDRAPADSSEESTAKGMSGRETASSPKGEGATREASGESTRRTGGTETPEQESEPVKGESGRHD
jgi:hypothetical protein